MVSNKCRFITSAKARTMSTTSFLEGIDGLANILHRAVRISTGDKVYDASRIAIQGFSDNKFFPCDTVKIDWICFEVSILTGVAISTGSDRTRRRRGVTG